MGAPELRTETEIDAPPERVWQVLIDMARWDEWNPTFFAVRGEPKVGEVVRMKLKMAGLRIPMRQRILVVDPPRELVWNPRRAMPRAIDVIRRFRIWPIDGGRRSRFEQSESTTGFLAAVEVRLLAKVIVKGFDELGRALARRVALESS